jgi:FdhD protein
MQEILSISVDKVSEGAIATVQDMITVEEPLEIRLRYNSGKGTIVKSISVTMRTPGNDSELATGFLFTEGIITSQKDIAEITQSGDPQKNVVYVTLSDNTLPDVSKLERNFYTTSSCGVCGKSSIEAVRIACTILDTKDEIRIPREVLFSLPDKLRGNQEVFANTGSIHACGLFDLEGSLFMTREDVGRHNALDKLIGACAAQGNIPLDNHILLLSGRTSFELVQKAAMAGIKIVAAVGAPSSLAVQMADEWGMTLIGFLRGRQYNVYSGAERII